MTERKWIYGKSVDNGLVRYLSPSAMTTADAASDGGCLRKWYYQALLGIRSPQTKSQEIGVALHAEVEDYLRTGIKALGSLAMSGAFMIPKPGDDLLIEHDIAGGDLDSAPLSVEGVPILGYIDLIHDRGTNQGASDIEDTLDPPGTCEIIDWKTSGSAKYIKSPLEMSRTIQMTTYGAWAYRAIPEIKYVRLSHCYFITKGPGKARKVTLRVQRDQIDERMEHIGAIVRSVKQAAGCTSPNDVPANLSACDAFGGCPAQSVCTANAHASLASLVGQTAAQGLMNARRARTDSTPGDQMTPTPGGLLARTLARGKATPEAPTAEPKASLLPGKKAAPDAAAELLKLKAEERAAQLAKLPPGFAQAITDVEAAGMGMPMLTGACAAAYALVKNLGPIKGGALAGSGDLAGANDGKGLSTCDEMITIAGELAALAAETEQPVNQTMGILPDDVPESDPKLASEKPEPEPEVEVEQPTSQAAGALAQVVAQADVGKTKRTRRTKAEMEAAKVTESGPIAVPAGAASKTGELPINPAAEAYGAVAAIIDATPGADKLYVYVGCAPSCPYEKLAAAIDAICDDLAKSQGVDDIRVADKGPLGFGKWSAVLGAYVYTMFIPSDGEPNVTGHFVLDMVGGISDVVAETLRRVCNETGGVFVRGAR